MDMFGFRKVEALTNLVTTTNHPGPSPDITYLEPSKLVINEEYQRELSTASLRQIAKMATKWSWSSFKALSVAPTDDPEIFEVVDGQHTAIAAITNGNIEFLPCVIMDAKTLEEKANGFLGINRGRIALTPAAIYAAEVSAKDEAAMAVEVALSISGARVIACPPAKGNYKVGDVLAIAALKGVVSRVSGDRLLRVMTVAVNAQCAPVTGAMIKAIDIALPIEKDAKADGQVTEVIHKQGSGNFEMMCKLKTARGARNYETMADTLAELAKLPGKRMGLAKPKLNAKLTT